MATVTGRKNTSARVMRNWRSSRLKPELRNSLLVTPYRPFLMRLFECATHGIGIAADQLPSIFEMFTQIDTSLERTRSGLGIGLTLAKNLVELHGGTLEVHSAGLGQGSEFVVRLPVIEQTPTVADSQNRPASRADHYDGPTHPCRR